MKINHVGEHVYSSDDIFDLVMQGHDVLSYRNMVIDDDVDLVGFRDVFENDDFLENWQPSTPHSVSLEEFDRLQQNTWYMPKKYQDIDIAKYVLELCDNDAELQRIGKELLMFQERGMFDLLRYLVYLVDIMRDNNIIWGVGRGSSVASFVLYKLGVHRVNSLYYDLDPAEFLR